MNRGAGILPDAWCGKLLDFLQICNLLSLYGRAGKNHSVFG